MAAFTFSEWLNTKQNSTLFYFSNISPHALGIDYGQNPKIPKPDLFTNKGDEIKHLHETKSE